MNNEERLFRSMGVVWLIYVGSYPLATFVDLCKRPELPDIGFFIYGSVVFVLSAILIYQLSKLFGKN